MCQPPPGALTNDTLVDATQLVDQVTGGRRLAGVDVTDDHCTNTTDTINHHSGGLLRHQVNAPQSAVRTHSSYAS